MGVNIKVKLCVFNPAKLWVVAFFAMFTSSIYAGTLAQVLLLKESDATNALDNQLILKPLKWDKGVDEIEFFVCATDRSRTFPSPPENPGYIRNYPDDIYSALANAANTWNKAKHSKIKIREFFLLTTGVYDPYTERWGGITRAQIDGVNTISFSDTTDNEGDSIVSTWISFFYQNVDLQVLGNSGVINIDEQRSILVPGDLTRDPNEDDDDPLSSQLRLSLINVPIQKYKQGTIFDVDILFNATAAPTDLVVLPDDKHDLEGTALAGRRYLGSFDIQAIATHEFGWSLGLGNSLIVDSAMSHVWSSSPNSAYPTDPYRRRNLSFDDEMTLAIAEGVDTITGSTTAGGIGGQVLNGAILGVDITGDQQTGGSSGGSTGSDSDTYGSLFVMQAPVYVALPLETAQNIPAFSKHLNTELNHPDDIWSRPRDAGNAKYRLLAHVLTGQSLAFPSILGSNPFETDDDDSEYGYGDDGPTMGDGSDTNDLGVPLEYNLNSNYLLPGLPAFDNFGKPVEYAVYLEGKRNGALVSEATLSQGTTQFLEWQPNSYESLTDTIAFPGGAASGEFYGVRSDAALSFGTGGVAPSYNTFDDLFANMFITVQFDYAGRIAAAMTNGPDVMSGFGMKPNSYVNLQVGDKSYSNRYSAIGVTESPLKITDAAGTAEGSWGRAEQFILRTDLQLSNQGASSSAFEITYTITNKSSQEQPIVLTQVVDTALMGRENPAYVINEELIDKARTIVGSDIPQQIMYQTSIVDPFLQAYIYPTLPGSEPLESVTIGELSTLISGVKDDSGVSLRGALSETIDTGIGLRWNLGLMKPNETRVCRFIVGFLPSGLLKDTWVPYPEDSTTIPSGYEDDPAVVTPVPVYPGIVHDGIDIITNEGNAPTAATIGEGPSNGYTAAQFQLISSLNGFPKDKLLTIGGACGDIDNDGDLDVVTAVFAGQTGEALNRIYLNEQRISPTGTIEYYFRDVTLGEDGVLGTTDDRFDPPYSQDQTQDVLLADFDNDGWLDIVFINNFSDHRYYQNLGPEKPGFFKEIPGMIPPILNGTPLGPIDSGYAGLLPNAKTAVVGDIDSDGDLDIIITHYAPFTDGYVYQPGMYGTRAWADVAPTTNNPDVFGDGLMTTSEDLFSEPLLYLERVLINQLNVPMYAESWHPDTNRMLAFVDETLGSDDTVGTLTGLEFELDATGQFYTFTSWEPSEIDRIPPIFPVMLSMPQDRGSVSAHPSPMGIFGGSVSLGAMFGSSALDLLSVRSGGGSYDSSEIIPMVFEATDQGGDTAGVKPAQDAPTPHVFYGLANTPLYSSSYGGEHAYFRNVDIFSFDLDSNTSVTQDLLADGYFACFNYDFDVTRMRSISYSDSPQTAYGNGLFAYHLNPNDVPDPDDPTKPGLMPIADPFPLLIGIPEGLPGDSGTDTNIIPAIDAPAWTGIINDWSNSGSPKPLLMTDNRAGAPPPYTFSIDQDLAPGFRRGIPTTDQDGEVRNSHGGYSITYMVGWLNPFTYFTAPAPGWTQLLNFTAAEGSTAIQTGSPFSVASADFNLDGSPDLFVANQSLVSPIIWDSGSYLTDPAPKQLFLNDGFGRMVDSTPVSITNATNAMKCITGDFDNDGDPDVIVFNAFAPADYYINQAFSSPPDITNKRDSMMFIDTSSMMIPPYSMSAIIPPFPDTISLYAGVTKSSITADINMDGRPDIVSAEGSIYTNMGSFVRAYVNTGPPKTPSTPIFKPLGANYPAPRTLTDNSNLYSYIGLPGYISQVVAVDIDNDGDNDLIVAYDGPSPYSLTPGAVEILINYDAQELADTFGGLSETYSSVPDDDLLGDGIFLPLTGAIPQFIDPVTSGTYLRKYYTKSIAVADFNNDGLVDIVLGNGYANSGGAENVLLLQDPEHPLTFIDATDHFPMVEFDGAMRGILDQTNVVAVGDFDADGDVDIVFGNYAPSSQLPGFRMLLNDGEGSFTETLEGERIPAYRNMSPQAIIVADFDNLGEWTEDVNFNGILDPGEDLNGNGLIDWIDLPDETIYGDLNHDGIITKRTDGTWDGSLDMFISFDQGPPTILINDPTNQNPGYFTDETSLRFGEGMAPGPYRGAAAGDLDLDGDLDIVVANYVGGITAPVKIWINTVKSENGHIRHGFFVDATHEIPYPRSLAEYSLFYDLEGTRNERVGPREEALIGWASDVNLIDVDGDGDLDIHVSCLGSHSEIVLMGSPNLFYTNRLIGLGWNAETAQTDPTIRVPMIFKTSPYAARPDTKGLRVTLYGSNFEDIAKALASSTPPTPNSIVGFGRGITVTKLESNQENSQHVLYATIDIDDDTRQGPRTITIRDPQSGRSSTTKPGVFKVVIDAGDFIENNTYGELWWNYE